MSHQSKASKNRVSHRETFNQIVLMLIVAFALRVFVVEAFVIPTGSMATTLKGAHARFACDNCGYQFDVNYSSRSSGGEISIPRTTPNSHTINCPNCGYSMPSDQSDKVRVFYGDRILVNKYAYLLREPQRWDVVVFKAPERQRDYHFGQAYIKRLIGRPGEKIMILDGDIYVTNASDPTPADWKIQTKPDIVQDALWRIVHDSDYAPKGLTPESRVSYETYTAERYLPWKPSNENWIYTRGDSGARTYNFRSAEGSGTLAFDREIGRDSKFPLTDFLAYDQALGTASDAYSAAQRIKVPVSDLKLSMFYERRAGKGPLELKLSKRETLFTASIEPDGVALYMSSLQSPEARRLIEKKAYAFPARPVKLEFMNLDYRVRLMIDGQDILATTPRDYAPDVAALLNEQYEAPYPTVSITASAQVASIAHLSLWRDVYYLNERNGQSIARGGPRNPVVLGPDEYFTLGDNSPLSSDGRYWTESVNLPAEDVVAQAGVVPGRFLQGKAMLVYWPAGYRLLGDNLFDLVPNFAEMRFIH